MTDRSLPDHRQQASNTTMQWTQWIWFVGCVAWIIDAVANAQAHDLVRAKLALAVAAVFLIAGLVYSAQKR